MPTKIIIVFFILINLNFPIVSLIDFLIICVLFLFIISSKTTIYLKNLFFQKYIYFFILITLTIINFFSPKIKIEEAHSVFVNYKDLDVMQRFLPINVIEDIGERLKKFEINRMIQSYSLLNSHNDYFNLQTINKPYAYSSDSFFQKNKFSRKVRKINFSNRGELRIGDINTLKYNFQYIHFLLKGIGCHHLHVI